MAATEPRRKREESLHNFRRVGRARRGEGRNADITERHSIRDWRPALVIHSSRVQFSAFCFLLWAFEREGRRKREHWKKKKRAEEVAASTFVENGPWRLGLNSSTFLSG